MKPKDQMKTALLICALTSMSPAFANGTMVKADNLNHPTTSIQQQKKVATGRVVDNQGEPLIGVTVMEVGTSNGTVTDLDGKFSLSLKNPNGKITISYIGFNPQTLTAASNMQITMKSEDKELNEVVVVGYGTQKKVNLTGSVSSVDSKALESRPIQNLQSGLQGMMPGVTISGTNGAPGMDSGSINVRGVGTLNSSSPYILIDGVESGTMSSLDPNDIESISVLKDAASAAIYGSKAANGVILITTKRGKSGKPQVSYNGYVSVQNPTSLVDRLDSYEYAHMLNDALESEGKAKKFTSEEEINALPNTDWYDLAYKTGSLQHHNVSVNGATESVNYLASVGYLKQSGILPHAGREQVNGRTNLEMKINSRLTARLNLAYIKNDYTDPSSAYAGGGSDQIIRQLNLIAPWITARYDDGTWGTISDGSPIAWLDNDLKVYRRNTNFTGLFGVDYKIIDGLVAKLSASYVNNNQNYDYFQKYFVYNENKKTDPNFHDERVYKWERKTFEALLNYNKTFGQHTIGALAGWHAEAYDYKYWYTYRKNFPNNSVTDINAGDVSTQQAQGYTRELNMLSWFGRVNYDFAGRYLFEANLRYDGSSRFLRENRWNFFPSFSAGWNIAREKFWEPLTDYVNTLKLRASWGQLGNQNTDNWYPFYPTIGFSSQGGNWLINGAKPNTASQPGLVSSTLTWEKSRTWEVGLDWGAFNNRLTGSFGYYQRKTFDMVGPAPELPVILGANPPKVNNLDMTSKGWDLQIGWRDVIGEVSYGASLVLSDNQVVIDKYPNPSKNLGSYYAGAKLGDIWGYTTIGIAQSQEDMDAHLAKVNQSALGSGWTAGDIMYADLDGDGYVNTGENTADKPGDRRIIGNSTPRYNFGLNLDAAWKGFDIKVFFQGTLKRDYAAGGAVFWGAIGQGKWQATGFKFHEDYWREDNKGAYYPRADWGGGRNIKTQTRYLQNAAYGRLKNLTIGYTLPKSITSKAYIENLRFFVSGENLFTITNFTEAGDPELIGAGYGGEIGKTYPLSKTFSFGLSVTF